MARRRHSKKTNELWGKIILFVLFFPFAILYFCIKITVKAIRGVRDNRNISRSDSPRYEVSNCHFSEASSLCVQEISDHAEDQEPRIVTNEDMAQFTNMPFHFRDPIKTYGPGSIDPWYMELGWENEANALDQIAQLNAIVQQSYRLSTEIPLGLCIPENRISRTGIICTPYTKTGKISKYPCYLYFIVDDTPGNQTSGRIYYAQDGSMGKARIALWKDHVIYSLSYKTVGVSFVLDKVETNFGVPEGEPNRTIYKL